MLLAGGPIGALIWRMQVKTGEEGKMGQFAIGSYQVSQSLQRFTAGETRRERILHLRSVPDQTNTVITTDLVYSTRFDAWGGDDTPPVVGYASKALCFCFR